MRRLIEKTIIALLSLYASFHFLDKSDFVAFFLISLLISIALDISIKKKHRYILYLLFAFLVLYNNSFLYYLPLVFYNLYIDFKHYSLLSIFFLLVDFSPILLIIGFLSFYFSSTGDKMEETIDDYKVMRDSLKEDTLFLKKYNEQLSLDKEKNIHIAILTERNRIAREIHDSIGHTISSSILQVEAIKTLADDCLGKPLDQLKNTLIKGMNDVRKSLKGLRDESLDLKTQVESLIDATAHLHIEFIYNIDADMDYNFKFDILSIIKEAITNTSKHSDASQMKISLLSQPKFYNLIIVDNGSNKPSFKHKGIGLDYIEETANKYNGHFNYHYENGFRIHLSLMKGK